jgi:hypothetical protein
VKRLLVAIALACGLAIPVLAAADPAPPAEIDPSLLSEHHMRQPEVLTEKPSGFWTSNRPAVGGAYRYRMMLVGIAIAAIMGTVIVVVIKRNTRRAA